MISAQVYHVVAAIIRRQGQILLVQQQGPGDERAAWALPGGLVEAGELLHEAVRREVSEETGLTVTRLGALAYSAQVDNRVEGDQLLAFVFEVAEWHGEILPADPDEFILAAAFLPLAEAVNRLAALPWPVMREPILAYLRGEVAPGALWLYRHEQDGTIRRQEVIAGG